MTARLHILPPPEKPEGPSLIGVVLLLFIASAFGYGLGFLTVWGRCP